MPIVKPIHARDGEVVDIHWHTLDGIHVQRVTCPPRPTRDARQPSSETTTPQKGGE